MKTAIKLSALLLLVSTGLFAATPVKAEAPKDEITLQQSSKDMSVGLIIEKEEAGKSFVKFYDKAGSELFVNYLPTKQSSTTVYNIADLDLGDYTMQITSNEQVVTKQLHIYEEYGKKAYIFLQ